MVEYKLNVCYYQIKVGQYPIIYINKLCKEERAKLNDKISKGNKKCKEGDVITLVVPEPEELEILPEEMDLDIA